MDFTGFNCWLFLAIRLWCFTISVFVYKMCINDDQRTVQFLQLNYITKTMISRHFFLNLSTLNCHIASLDWYQQNFWFSSLLIIFLVSFVFNDSEWGENCSHKWLQFISHILPQKYAFNILFFISCPKNQLPLIFYFSKFCIWKVVMKLINNDSHKTALEF